MRTLLIRWLLLQACDVYSFGVLAWEVWEGEEPWAGLSLKDIWRVVVIEGQRLPIQGNHITPLLEKCLRSPSQCVSITEVHTPTCIPAVCPRCVLKQLHIHYRSRLSLSNLFLTVQLCRVHPQIVNLHNCYGGLQSVGEPKCSWCIEHTHNSIIPCMLLQVVSKLLSAISDQSICHHYSQEKIA